MKIGLLQSLTGVAAVDGETVVKAAKLAAREINSRLEGPRIELLIQDDHADAKNSISAFHQIVQSRPEAIIGGSWSYLANALSPVAVQTKVPLINTSTIPECVKPEKFSGLVFTMAPEARVENAVFIPKLTKGSTAVLVSGPTGYSEAHREAFRKIALAQGVNILQELNYSNITGEDAGSLAPKVKQLDPDIVYIILPREQFDTFLRRIRELAVRSQVLADKNGYFAFLISKNLNAYEGVCLSYPLASLKKSPDFIKNYETSYGEEPQMYADVSFDAVKLLYEATLRARRENRVLQEILPEMSFEGIGGTYRYQEGRFLSDFQSSLVCIKGGVAQIQQ